MGSDMSLKTWLLRHLTDYMIGACGRARPFATDGTDVRGSGLCGPRRGAGAAPARTAAAAAIWHLFVRERLRRETVASLAHVPELCRGQGPVHGWSAGGPAACVAASDEARRQRCSPTSSSS
jgi:hypothetical protein